MPRSLVLFAVWTLLVVPIFCLGGVLSHVCDCHAESKCSHEDDCAADPCATAVRPPDGAASSVVDALSDVPAAPRGFIDPLLAATSVGDRRWEGARITGAALSARFLPLLI